MITRSLIEEKNRKVTCGYCVRDFFAVFLHGPYHCSELKLFYFIFVKHYRHRNRSRGCRTKVAWHLTCNRSVSVFCLVRSIAGDLKLLAVAFSWRPCPRYVNCVLRCIGNSWRARNGRNWNNQYRSRAISNNSNDLDNAKTSCSRCSVSICSVASLISRSQNKTSKSKLSSVCEPSESRATWRGI